MVGNNRITVTALEQFLNKPPSGFSVKTLDFGYEVHGDPEKSLVLIDDLELKGRKVVFHNSIGRTVKMHDLWEYTSTRKSLLSKTVYLLASACEGRSTAATGKAASKTRESQRFVVSVDGDDPFVKWQLERGLDWTIASVRGESYRVDVDLSEALESWAAKNLPVKPVWRDASFTLKYCSDALFDFPHWLGFSKRKFSLRLT